MLKRFKNLKEDRKKFIIFMILSLLIHVGLILFPTKKTKKEAPMFVVERITLPKRQVVDDTKNANRQKPKDSKYLSKHDNAVKKETKAARTAKTKNSQNNVLVKPKVDKKVVKRATPKKKLTMADLAVNPMRPMKRSPSTYSPPSTTDDYLPDVETSTQTSLNSREFKFYSYFERIKDRLRMYWEPQLTSRVNQLYQRGQRLPDIDLMTKLNIILNKNGELSKISITRNSGIEEIDAAALKAFELAAPFPNPPSGMVEKNGDVKLTWSFIVQTRGISDIFVFLSKR